MRNSTWHEQLPFNGGSILSQRNVDWVRIFGTVMFDLYNAELSALAREQEKRREIWQGIEHDHGGR